jgi:hypothetical protein
MGVALSNGTQENLSIMEQAGKPVLDNGAISPIVSGCITIIKLSQQSSVISHQSSVNSQQSTITDGATEIDIRYHQFYNPSIAHHLQ